MINTGKTKLAIKVLIAAIVLLLIVIGLVGACSGNGTLTAPGPAFDKQEAAGLNSTGENGRMLWGLFNGVADPEKQVFELTADRAAAMHVNLTGTLNDTLGIDAIPLWAQSDIANGVLAVRITLHNPFSTIPRYTGFDVRGIFITMAGKQLTDTLWTAGDNNPVLQNPDGYTRWWNPWEFTDPGLYGYTDGDLGNKYSGDFDAKLNGYKIFADALSNDDSPALLTYIPLGSSQGRAVFSAGPNSRTYIIHFPPGISHFNYAVDASWAPPVSSPPQIPVDFPPGANCKEAWLVELSEVANTLAYDPNTGDTSGELTINAVVHDWQGAINNNTAPEISSVKAYSPTLFGSGVGTAVLDTENGTSATYTTSLGSICSATSAGKYTVCFEVTANNAQYKQFAQAAPAGNVAAYATIDIDVAQATPSTGIKDFGLAVHILQGSTSPPAVTQQAVLDDIAYADAFWSQYGFGINLDNISNLTSDAYYNLDPNDSANLFSLEHDTTGLVNVYYVNSIVGQGGAFAMIPCTYTYCRGDSAYIIFDGPDNVGLDEVLTHELGHIIGFLEDTYLIDQGYTCNDLAQMYCSGNTNLFCDANDAVWGNMMYYINGAGNTPVSFYSLSDADVGMLTGPINSQAENAVYFHTNYPSNFKDTSGN